MVPWPKPTSLMPKLDYSSLWSRPELGMFQDQSHTKGSHELEIPCSMCVYAPIEEQRDKARSIEKVLLQSGRGTSWGRDKLKADHGEWKGPKEEWNAKQDTHAQPFSVKCLVRKWLMLHTSGLHMLAITQQNKDQVYTNANLIWETTQYHLRAHTCWGNYAYQLEKREEIH